MRLSKKQTTGIRWLARIMASAILLFGLPFYFGYGNPLPFANPDNSLLDNIWLTTFPLMFIGLAIGWKYEKLGGYVVVFPILTASIIGFIIRKEGLPGPMFAPMIAGILFIIVGRGKQ